MYKLQELLNMVENLGFTNKVETLETDCKNYVYLNMKESLYADCLFDHLLLNFNVNYDTSRNSVQLFVQF